MISTRPLISKSPNLYTKPLVSVLSLAITIDIVFTLMYHSFLHLSRKEVFHLSFIQSYPVVSQNGKVH